MCQDYRSIGWFAGGKLGQFCLENGGHFGARFWALQAAPFLGPCIRNDIMGGSKNGPDFGPPEMIFGSLFCVFLVASWRCKAYAFSAHIVIHCRIALTPGSSYFGPLVPSDLLCEPPSKYKKKYASNAYNIKIMLVERLKYKNSALRNLKIVKQNTYKNETCRNI